MTRQRRKEEVSTSYTTRSDEKARLVEQGRRFEMARCGMRPRISQAQMAELVSDLWGRRIGRSVIAGIEDGRRDAEQGILKAVAELSGLSQEWLRGDRTIPGFVDPWHDLALSGSYGQGYLNLYDNDLLTAVAS